VARIFESDPSSHLAPILTYMHVLYTTYPEFNTDTATEATAQFTPPDRQDKTVLCVSCLYVCRYMYWTIAVNVFRLQSLCR